MSYSFDFENSVIEILSPQTEVDCQDLINAIRTAEASEEGIQYAEIAVSSGKNELGDGVFVGITIELLGNWQLHFWEGAYIAKIAGGNLIGGPGGDPIAYSAGVQVLLIQSAAATITTISTGSGLSVEEHNALMAIPTSTELPGVVYNAQTSQYTQSGSYGLALGLIHAIQVGRWKIDVNTNQMILYGLDNNTEIAKFDLFDSSGTSSSNNVFERVPV